MSLLKKNNQLELAKISGKASSLEIAQAIQHSGSVGALLITDLTPAPFDAIGQLFDRFVAQPALGELVNRAYTKNLVYKDAFGTGNGGPTVDQKRVLDISPERLHAIVNAQAQITASPEEAESIDSDLAAKLGTALEGALGWWASLEENLRGHILQALALAIGSEDCMRDVHSNYRMVDYYAHPVPAESETQVPPRCGEHRDFGAFTLIFADKPGLEFFVDGEWRSLAPLPSDSAVLLFGWCTELWSNGRIHAALHRVINQVETAEPDEEVARRLSAVLFVAPKDVNTPLEPHVLPGELRQYISGVKVGQLRGGMARKWRRREGTLNSQERELEEEEIRERRLVTQDDVVRQLAGVYA